MELDIEKPLQRIQEVETKDEGDEDLNDRVDERPQTMTEEEK